LKRVLTRVVGGRSIGCFFKLITATMKVTDERSFISKVLDAY
jgi:hypothetical protein